MRWRTLVALGAALFIPLVSHATAYYGWADKFTTSSIACLNDNCSGVPWFDGSGDDPRKWEAVGQQGHDSTGRSNARERLEWEFADNNTNGCSTQTAQISRYRTTSPPSQGSSCSATASFVTSTSITVDSCIFSNGDTYYRNGYSPTLNFSTETASGATIGYRSITTVTNSLGAGPSITNCFKIVWQ